MMNSNDNQPSSSGSGHTLRRPVQVVKKRSGPLDDALAELATKEVEPPKVAAAVLAPVVVASTGGASTSQSTRRRHSHVKDKEKEKRRERWLLTRKTWKYMTDAGRKLIPDGAQNRKEDIPKIEAHFQHVCSSEPRFILWRRKSSYPGAMRSSKKRLKQLLHHTGQKHTVPLTVEQIEQDEANNADQIIDLLQSFLKLDESLKTTTLLGSKTVRPDQTASPSAQRPGGQGGSRGARSSGGGFLGMQMPSRDPFHQLGEIDQLLERLRALQRSATSPAVSISPDLITRDILEDKALLKQIYNSLKKQQLHRILSKHSSSGAAGMGTHSMSLTSLLNFGSGGGHFSAGPQATRRNETNTFGEIKEATEPITSSSSADRVSAVPITTKPVKKARTRRSPPKSLDLSVGQSGNVTKKKTAHVAPQIVKSFNACGTQTNFIPLQEIKRLAEEYKEMKRDSTQGNTDDEAEKLSGKQPATGVLRRKSSIDNEDVSQSVSDTIKRYLRMARKKSVHDDAANRFKRVNYDRNLRNIRAKGEINPPGMDEGNSKAIQTLDAWPLITLDFIRGHENSGILEMAHSEWQKALDERIHKKLEYERNLADSSKKPGSRSCSSSSAPTSPTSPLSTSSEHQQDTSYSGTGAMKKNPNRSTSNYFSNSGSAAGGILHSSSQFLSNLWHGGSQHDDVSNKSSVSLNSNSSENKTAMQKSKSSSNVGQFVSRKLLRSRSKSQTRPSSTSSNTNYSKWAPADKNTWTSETGDRLTLNDAPLQNLSNIEAEYLQRVALEKISELNIGINLKLDKHDKAMKRRVLPKKKAMTTSFFDIGKKDDQGSCFGIFGNSLECCIANDRKQSKTLNGAQKERGSRGSIASIFRSGGDSIRSCESLPSTAAAVIESTEKESGNVFGSLAKSSSMLLSSSQWDMRRKSQDFDGSEEFAVSKGFITDETDLQVPTFVNSCIRYLEENGLNKVGLFRVSTSKKRVKQMRDDFNKNHSRQITADTCPHDVATLLKEFLRDLPEPLLCNHLFKAFLQTQKIRNRRLQLEAISHLIKLLPVVHRDTLYVLLRFLANVAAHSDDVSAEGNVLVTGNKMDSNNLATVFAPNILRTTVNDGIASGEAADAAAQQEFAINVIRTMIDHYEELFKVPAELIDIAYSYMLDECPEQLFSICEQKNVALASPSRVDGSTSISPLSSPDQGPAPTEASSKKFYTRQSVMHENDASKTIRPSIRSHSRSRKERYPSRESTSADRRQSSPNVLGKANVVSGSLQITVPKPILHGSQQYDDLPYIEDVFYSPTETPSEYMPISGLLSISTKAGNVDATNAAATFQNTQTTVDARKKPSGEPKLPASISNIGGAILRSKTADFERMSTKEPKSAVASSKPSQSVMQAQHLYKRQELISSQRK